MSTKVGPSGPAHARLMIVGEAPGADEVREERPFVGKAGQTLRQFLMEVGIDPAEVFFTNLCQYQPPANKLEKFFLDGGVPNPQVLEGMAALAEQIRTVRPNLILALGNFPMRMLTGKGRWMSSFKDGQQIRGYTGIGEHRGSIYPCTLVPDGPKVMATWHPAYIIREGMKDHGIFKADLAKAAEQSAFPEIRRRQRATYLARKEPLILTGYEDARGGITLDHSQAVKPIWETSNIFRSRNAVKEYLLGNPFDVMTLDIEYIGSSLLCVGVTTSSDRAFVIPIEGLDDLLYMQSIVTAGNGINAQNSMFDAGILEWHYKIPIMQRVVFDTLLASYAAAIELPKSLDFLLSIYTDIPYHKGMIDWKLVKAGKQSRDLVYAYNGIDVYGQHEVMEQQLLHELEDPSVRASFDFNMALLSPLWDMSKRGIRVNKELIAKEQKWIATESARLGMELMMIAGKPVNPRPSKECIAFLYEQLGLPVLKRGKKDPSTDDKTLAALSIRAGITDAQRRSVNLIREARRVLNLGSKFFDIEFDEDGRMRGTYNPVKAVTARLVSVKFFPTGKGTNQQNIPRDERARRVFQADPGKVFGFADLERAESLVVAQLTGDPRMLADHEPGKDAHTSLGVVLFHKPAEEITKDERYLAKKTRHAGNYMQGPRTFMNNINQDAHKTGVSIDYAEAEVLIQGYRNIHPFLKAWWSETERKLYATRTLHNLLGMHRTFYGHIDSILPEAVAFVPQSTVGQLLNVGFLNLHGIPCPYMHERGLWDSYKDIGAELLDCGFEALQQVHDSVGWQLNERDADRALPLIRKALEVPLRNPNTYEDFTILAELQIDVDPERIAAGTSNWGDCVPIELCSFGSGLSTISYINTTRREFIQDAKGKVKAVRIFV